MPATEFSLIYRYFSDLGRGAAVDLSVGDDCAILRLGAGERLATSVDTMVARSFSQIKTACRKKGFVASDFDFLIAATAQAHGLVLATLNIRHFHGMESLAVEDWSQA